MTDRHDSISVYGHAKVKRAITVALTESVPLLLIYGPGSAVPDLVEVAFRQSKRLEIPFTAKAVLRCSCGFYGTPICGCSASAVSQYRFRMRRLATEYVMFCDDNDDLGIPLAETPEHVEFMEQELIKARCAPPPALPSSDAYVAMLRHFVSTYRYLDHFGLQMTASAVARLGGHSSIEIPDLAEALGYQYSTISIFQNLRAAVNRRHQPRGEREQLIRALIDIDLEAKDWIIGKVLRHGFKGYDNMTMDELEVMRKLKV